MQLLLKADAVAVQETHSTPGVVGMASSAQNTRAWWSHEGQSTGGVGILVRKGFLEHFVEDRIEWVEVVPGRAAILRLDGPEGSLDICTVYLPTGDARAQRRRISIALAGPCGHRSPP